MARSDPQVNIRMPQDLKERLEAATIVTNRSLNGEIIARLELSFDGPVNQEEVERLLEKLSERSERNDAQIAARDRLLSVTGIYLRLVVERVAKSEDPVSNRLMALTGRYADSIVHGDYDGALKVAMDLVNLGIKVGVLDEHGQVKPEFAHIAEPDRPRRKTPISFRDAIEGTPPPPGKQKT